MTLFRNFRRRLVHDDRGATMIEFAFVGPIFFMFVFGIFDVSYAAYNKATLQGVVEDAGRDAGLETGISNKSAIDAKITAQMLKINKGAKLTFERKNYESFNDVGTPEDFVDANGNGTYDSTECFTDMNSNGSWDSDMGSSGLGNADDVVVYKVTLKYDSIFPLWRFLGRDKVQTMSSATTLKSQPYADQAARTGVSICPPSP